MNIFQGVSASKGIAFGTVFVLKNKSQRTIKKQQITTDLLSDGWMRFQKARTETLNYFTTILETSSPKQKTILESYILMLSDPEFISLIKTSYEKSLVCIEYIVDEKVNEFANQLRMANDEYLSARADDIFDVYGKLLDRLTNTENVSLDTIPANTILVAEFLNPSDAIVLSKKSIQALVLHEGSKNSHLSILARTYGIPLVFGITNISKSFFTGDSVIVDGNNSRIYVSPDDKTIQEYQNILSAEKIRKHKLTSFISKNACTKDGTPLSFYANIGSVDDAKLAVKNGAAGIGLFRTEFLFMEKASTNGSLMNENAQFESYKQVLQMMDNKPVTIRTIDAGGDKLIQAKGMPSGNEKNPLLGWRAIRFCLDRTDIFKTQLRALYRASVYGNLKIMIPLITTVEQLTQTKQLINEVQAELKIHNTPFNKDVPVGIMIETPSASVMSDVLAHKCDFFSIGTNDLTQYMLCVDRENEIVSKLFQELNPAVLRQIEYTFVSAQSNSIPITVCGEMASKQETLLALLAIGITTLSMSPTKILETKEFISKFEYATITALGEKITLCETSAEVEKIVAECITKTL